MHRHRRAGLRQLASGRLCDDPLLMAKLVLDYEGGTVRCGTVRYCHLQALSPELPHTCTCIVTRNSAMMHHRATAEVLLFASITGSPGAAHISTLLPPAGVTPQRRLMHCCRQTLTDQKRSAGSGSTELRGVAPVVPCRLSYQHTPAARRLHLVQERRQLCHLYLQPGFLIASSPQMVLFCRHHRACAGRRGGWAASGAGQGPAGHLLHRRRQRRAPQAGGGGAGRRGRDTGCPPSGRLQRVATLHVGRTSGGASDIPGSSSITWLPSIAERSCVAPVMCRVDAVGLSRHWGAGLRLSCQDC